LKDYRHRKVDTVFGTVSFRSPRIVSYACERPWYLRAMLVERGVCEFPRGMKAVGGWYPLLLKESLVYLRLWDAGWAEHRETPFWFAVCGNGDNALAAGQLESIGRLQLESPPRLIKERDWWHVPSVSQNRCRAQRSAQ
jgi:hypothetical protein